MKAFLLILGNVLGVYLVWRAVVEPSFINFSDPSTYHLDWGGPSLAGVLAVHCGPGLLYLVIVAWWLIRRVKRSRTPSAPSR